MTKYNEEMLDKVLDPDVSLAHPLLNEASLMDLCYTIFMMAKTSNGEDGGPTDWFTDTKPIAAKLINKIATQVKN